MKIDAIDKKILGALEENSRQPLSRLSKAARATREVVEYRVKRLEKSGVIKAYVARINQAFFVQGAATIRLQMKRSADIEKYFHTHSRINWFAELSSGYAVTFLYKDLQEIGNIVNSLIKKTSPKSHELSLYITEYQFSRRGLVGLQGKKEDVEFSQNRAQSYDKKDIIILQELCANARVKNVELSQKTGLGLDAIRLRIQALEKKHLLLGYTIVIDPKPIGYQGYYLFAYMNYDDNMELRLREYLRENKQVYFCTRCVGKYNTIFGVYTKNREGFVSFLKEFQEFFHELEHFEFDILVDEKKEVFVPQNLFRIIKKIS